MAEAIDSRPCSLGELALGVPVGYTRMLSQHRFDLRRVAGVEAQRSPQTLRIASTSDLPTFDLRKSLHP